MFNNYLWKPFYDTYSDDVVTDFYNPVFKESVSAKRVSAYFSGKALARYAEGLRFFSAKGGVYSLIISQDISEDDYEEIKKGYSIKGKLENNLLSSLDEIYSENEIVNLSNLAYLISVGVVEIKMAFVKTGIFHDKFAIFTDSTNNTICMRGSNNETDAALKSNYESFELTCSWLASDFDKKKILLQENKFNELWNNKTKGVITLDMPEVIKERILHFDKGEIIIEPILLESNALIFDLENNNCVIRKQGVDLENPNYIKYKRIYFKGLIKDEDGKRYYIYNSSSPRFILKTYNQFKDKCSKIGISVFLTKALSKFINEKNLEIEKRYNLGASIKNRDELVIPKFLEFKKIVDEQLTRRLRDAQMWDSFFMYSMKHSSNFGVPGSGKTSSVIGTFSVLDKFDDAVRIVVIGPKNCFISWKNEFIECFGDKKKLKVIDIQSEEYSDIQKKKNALDYYLGDSNLILINYEITPKLKSELSKIVSYKTLLVFDEVHKIKKAQDGIWATACLEIAKHANYIITMTGTPIPNSYLDLYTNLNILFPYDYKEFFGFSMNTLKNPSSFEIERLNNKLFPFFCRTNKKQLLVPEANDDIWIKSEANVQENNLLKIVKSKCSKNPLELFIRILQVESNPKMLLNKLDKTQFDDILFDTTGNFDFDYYNFGDEVKNLIEPIEVTSKMMATLNKIKELVRMKKKVIVWCIFNDSILSIKKFLDEMEIESNYINGNVSNSDRIRIIQSFQSGDFDVLITNPHTLAESVSLHSVCHDAIYFEYSFNLVHLLQSKDRIHRLGLPENQYTQYFYSGVEFDLFGDKISFDERVYDRLKEKEQNMLNSIDNNILENVYSNEEDLDYILNKF